MNDQNQQDDFPLLSYLKIFFRRKEVLIIASFFGLVMGICLGFLLPKEYKSSTVIMVEEGKTDNPLFDKLAVSSTVHQRLTTIRESMLGWNSITTLIKRLDMDKDVKTPKQFEGLVRELRNEIRIEPRSENIIELSYIGLDPKMTQAVVQNITDIFIERNKEAQNKETKDAILFIEEQLRVYKGKIKSAEIAQLQDQLDELLQDSTEKHPLVKQLRDRIDAKKAELKAQNLEFTQGDQLKLESNEAIVDNIKTALNRLEKQPPNPLATKASKTNDEVAKLMMLEKMENVMARDAAVNEGIYNMLLQRMETAKITQRLQASKEGTRYSIIEPARVPLDAFKPNRPLVAFAGLILGAMIGLGLVFSAEFMDKSFIDVEEAKEFLGVPLLGAVSKINTEESLQQEREKSRWLYSLTFVSGIMLIALTVTLTNLLK